MKFETRIRLASQRTSDMRYMIIADNARQAAERRYEMLSQSAKVTTKEIEVIPVTERFVFQVEVKPTFTLKRT